MAAIDDIETFSSSTKKKQEEKKRYGIIALDIETTGKGVNDIPFAIGFATCDISEPTEIQTFNVCLNLEKDPTDSLEEFWKEEELDMQCFEEFWKDKEDLFNTLQDPSRVRLFLSYIDFVEEFDRLLKKCEEMYPDGAIILTDTTLFDTVKLGNLLTDNCFMPLNYTRAGKYRSGVECDSFIMGLMGCTNPFDWRSLEDFKKENIDPLKVCEVAHDHHPENDAKHILVTYLAALQYAKNEITPYRSPSSFSS